MERIWSVALVVGLGLGVAAFPDGAPVDVCVKPEPNRPYHGRAQPQPPHTVPYSVLASSANYGPSSKISVGVRGSIPFKGFFLQARDAATERWIGAWEKAPNTTLHPECSSITHADPVDKLSAEFIWAAPPDLPPGRVFFTGTVLKEYGTFWSNLIADAVDEHRDF